MKFDMKKWREDMLAAPVKTTMPILSFPAVQMMGVSVRQFISNAALMACGMQTVARLCNMPAALGNMDLSIEAECFGANIRYTDDEVPTVIGRLIKDNDDAVALKIPKVTEGRAGLTLDTIRIASETITDRPVLAGAIGPFSLAGRLMDMTEILYMCFDEPETVHEVLKKATRFITDYILAQKEAGANGVILAEPAAGILSPALVNEFSCSYVREIIKAVQDDSFIVIYHNCGSVLPIVDDIVATGADGFHFGNAVDMAEILKHVPRSKLAFGNIDPAGVVRFGNPKSILRAVTHLMKRCCVYPNFVLSTGCDLPPMTPWANIDHFFDAAEMFNESFETALSYLKNVS